MTTMSCVANTFKNQLGDKSFLVKAIDLNLQIIPSIINGDGSHFVSFSKYN